MTLTEDRIGIRNLAARCAPREVAPDAVEWDKVPRTNALIRCQLMESA